MILIDGYPIDCAITEDHTVDNEVTEHPVEKGADITDHVRARPVVVTLEGVVSDTPIGAIAGQRGARDDNGRLENSPSDDARAWLLDIRNRREPVSIETSLGGYTDMLLESLSFPRSAQDGDSLYFRVTFRQASFVTNERTVIRTSQPRTSGQADRGNKPTQNAAAIKEERPKPTVDTTKQPTRRVLTSSGGSASGVSPSGRPLTASGGSGSRYSPSGKVLVGAGGSG